ncbi:hypothetical protein CTRI78_v005377 [Colletotrichum trifolii]|uniref:DUF7918 domain-containing protein n=1 Tax=Colletotrichum trifolii TaxID=5466 RepID=A0A4R8RF08_COLTR|nr:hypothetical protein CTRI78_v005377 [Colletotrichum trifolii]
MAIIDTLPAVNVSVRLQSSFSDAAEYPDSNARENNEVYLDAFERCSLNYIESQGGTPYSIHIDVIDDPSLDQWIYGSCGLLFLLFIDGQFMGKRFCHNDDFHRGRWHFAFRGKRHPNENSSALVQKDFQFQSVTTVENDPSVQQMRHARDLGLIHVKEPTSSEHFEIPEEALKGRPISHGTSFAQAYEVPIQPPRRASRAAFEKIVSGPLLATYDFKYRSRAALQIENIIQRDASPEPDRGYRMESGHHDGPAVSIWEDFEDYDAERLAQERLSYIEDEGIQINSKKRGFEDYCDLTQNDYQEARHYKIVKLNSGQVAIDLTLDD